MSSTAIKRLIHICDEILSIIKDVICTFLSQMLSENVFAFLTFKSVSWWTSVNCQIRCLIQLCLFRDTEKPGLHQAVRNYLGDGVEGQQVMEQSQAWESWAEHCNPQQ